MTSPRLPRFPIRATAVVAVALAVLAPAAHARNVRLMESVPDALRTTRAHDILGTLDLRFGGDSARGLTIVKRDVVVDGVGTTKVADVGDDDAVRPADHELCARAFEDAITRLAFTARGVRGTAIVGVISNYKGQVFNDSGHFECHAGALKAVVTLRAQIATGTVAPLAMPVATPPQPPVAPPPPATQPPVISPPPPAPDAPQPPAPTFQPLPPRTN